MSAPKTFLVVSETNQLGARVMQALKDQGHTSKSIATIGEARHRLKTMYKGAGIIIHLSTASVKQVAAVVRDLAQQSDLRAVPLLFIASHASEFLSSLEQNYRSVQCLDVPYTSEALSAAIEGLDFTYTAESKAKKETEIRSLSDESSWSTSKTKHSLQEQLSKKGIATSFLDSPIGGEYYVPAYQPEYILDTSYVPKSFRILQEVKKNVASASKWERGHLHRSAFFAHRMMLSMDVSARTAESVSSAALLWNKQVQGASKTLLRGDFLSQGSQKSKLAIGSQVKDTALWAMSELGDQEMGKILALMGRLIAGEECRSDDENLISASAVIISDLAGRACWQRGYWNPKAAHTFLRKIARGEYQQIHPAVVCCAAKFLVEAVSATPTRDQVSTKMWKQSEARFSYQLRNSRDVNPTEKRIPIPELSPGMRLARPLISFDGREVLEEDVLLDEDLIWRIWSLAAIRLLDIPVVQTVPQAAVT